MLVRAVVVPSCEWWLASAASARIRDVFR